MPSLPPQPNLLQLRQHALNLLDEAANTEGGAFPSGTGGVDTQDTIFYLNLKLNEAKNILCREAWPVQGVTTLTYPANAKSFVFAGMQTADGSATINCLDAATTGGPLRLAGRRHLNINCPAGSSTPYINTAGTPLFWYRSGESGIGLAPVPIIDTTLTLNSFVVPKDMSADSDTPAWLTPDLARLLVFYAAYMYTRKNVGDAKLGAMIEGWMSEFERGKEMLQARFYSSDPGLARLMGIGLPQGK